MLTILFDHIENLQKMKDVGQCTKGMGLRKVLAKKARLNYWEFVWGSQAYTLP